MKMTVEEYRKTSPYQTVEQAWADGYKTGTKWTETWTPGGPWWCRPDKYDDDAFKEHCDFLRDCNEAYLEGFQAGLASRQEND